MKDLNTRTRWCAMRTWPCVFNVLLLLMFCCFWFVDWAFCCFVVVEGDHQRRTGLVVLPSALLCRVLAHFSLDFVDIAWRWGMVGSGSTVRRKRAKREERREKEGRIKSSKCRIRDRQRPRHRTSPTAHHSRIGLPCTRTTRSQRSGTTLSSATHSSLFPIPQNIVKHQNK